MAKKSIRDMSPRERKHNSLEVYTFRSILLVGFSIGLLMMIIGIAIYINTALDQCITNGFNMSRNASFTLSYNTDLETLCRDVMDLYYSRNEAESNNQGTEQYLKKIREIEESEDYQNAIKILTGFLLHSDNISDIYIGMYERDDGTLVYIADPDEKDPRRPGDWEEVEETELNNFLEWNGDGTLYDYGNTEKYGWICTSGVPIYDENGETVGFVLVDSTLTDLFHGVNKFIKYYALTVLIATILFALLVAGNMRRIIVKPVNEMADAAEKYMEDRRTGLANRKHFENLKISTGNEVESLALVMKDMETEVADYEEYIRKTVAERERISTELSLATRIQADMVPNVFPAFPDRTEIDIFASMKPAKEVGGDFYDFFFVDDDHLGITIADVSGKGVPAALFMMGSIIISHYYAMSGMRPGKVLEMMNDQICSNNREDMFITIWLGILDLKSGRLIAANAGHEYPVVKKAQGEFKLLRDKHGFVVGGLPYMKYSDYELQLDPGSILFVYTDGAVEAMNEKNELYGTGRLTNLLNQEANGTSEQIVNAVAEDISAFVGEAPQYDDLTMMCVRYNGLKT